MNDLKVALVTGAASGMVKTTYGEGRKGKFLMVITI